MLRSLPLCLLLACGARTELGASDGGVDAGRVDAGRVDASADLGPPDAPSPIDAGIPDGPAPPPLCFAMPAGGLTGAVPIGPIDFPYVAIGVESPGSHSCERFFLRAGNTPAFDEDVINIEVPYPDDLTPGPRAAFMSAQIGGDFWDEEIRVDVVRADGLFDLDIPFEDWRGSVVIDYHDATTDLVLRVEDETYCNNFPLCL